MNPEQRAGVPHLSLPREPDAWFMAMRSTPTATMHLSDGGDAQALCDAPLVYRSGSMALKVPARCAALEHAVLDLGLCERCAAVGMLWAAPRMAGARGIEA